MERNSKISGITLIEIIIVIVVISLLSGITAQFLNLGFLGYYQGQNSIDVDSQAQVALNRLMNDLHRLRSASDITTANASDLTFTDLDGNVISYQVNGSQLQRNNLALANNVQSITFQYYDITGTVLVTPVSEANKPLIRLIKLNLMINDFNYTTGVTLWNAL